VGTRWEPSAALNYTLLFTAFGVLLIRCDKVPIIEIEKQKLLVRRLPGLVTLSYSHRLFLVRDSFSTRLRCQPRPGPVHSSCRVNRLSGTIPKVTG
jgi:hypothetical protein